MVCKIKKLINLFTFLFLGQYYNKGYYNKQQYGPANGLRIPGYYHALTLFFFWKVY